LFGLMFAMPRFRRRAGIAGSIIVNPGAIASYVVSVSNSADGGDRIHGDGDGKRFWRQYRDDGFHDGVHG